MLEKSIHEEIKWLEGQLESKKQSLKEQGGAKEEREMVRDIVKEAYSAPATLPPPTDVISDDDAQKKAYELQEREHEDIIKDLVALAFEKNLLSAMKAASALKNPHILDEFHDLLADQYYEKLLETRKIKS